MSDNLFDSADLGADTVLLASRCTACARVEFPERTQCPACGAASTPFRLTGPARARTVSAVLAQPPGSLREAPYDVCVAEFAEGICVIGLVDGPVTAGSQITPVIIEASPGRHSFGFRTVSP